jgi:tRNA threonylcarbamoyladenosine biosynthesis protein TsaE
MTARSIYLLDAAATRAIGEVLGKALGRQPLNEALLITLSGELGAGKTTLVGGFMAALGVTGPVRSPTYALMEPYELEELSVYHLDLYRLTDPAQLEDLGLRDLLRPQTILLVEWASRGGNFFAHPDLQITLSYPESTTEQGMGGRKLTLQSDDIALQSLIDGLVL